MKTVYIDWNDDYYVNNEETSYFSESDVVIHENGWVTVQQTKDKITHFSPHSIKRIIVTEKEQSDDIP